MTEDLKTIIAVAAGNSRISFAPFTGREPGEIASFAAADADDAAQAIAAAAGDTAAIVIASVNDPIADRIERSVELQCDGRVYRVGRDLAVPIANSLDDESTVGQDRLLCAFGAYRRARQACVIIDAGTAITVDFVDGEGTFHGGAIAPGLRMMLTAMHEHTSALPQVAFQFPDPARGVLGKDTEHAMLLGVIAAARGLVRHLVDQYAEMYGAYPQVIATGGDARALFDNDEIVEHIVPDLQLIGIAETCTAALNDDTTLDPDTEDE